MKNLVLGTNLPHQVLRNYYVSTQERHHRVIRRFVVNTLNTRNLEQGLAEDLVARTLRDLRAQPLRDGFIDPHPASQSMVRTLVHGLGCSGVSVTTCVKARSHNATLHRGDVVLYTYDDAELLAGDIVFFACSPEWGECAFITAWDRVAGQPGFWSFNVRDALVRVPVSALRCSATAHIGVRKASLVCPPLCFRG